MKVVQKWEDMALYLYIAMKQYPKSERHTLVADTTNALWNIGTYITRANMIRATQERRRMIEAADMELSRLKILVRMGMLLKFMDMKKYGVLSGQMVEIGKMLGGWLHSPGV
jgi:hypothetical protein